MAAVPWHCCNGSAAPIARGVEQRVTAAVFFSGRVLNSSTMKENETKSAETMAQLNQIQKITDQLLKVAAATPKEFGYVYEIAQNAGLPEGSLSEIYSAYVDKNAAIFAVLKHVFFNGVKRPETIEEFEANGGFNSLDITERNIEEKILEIREGR